MEYTRNDGDQIFSYVSRDGFEAAQTGDVQRLPSGNTLVAYSNDTSVIQEVTPKGEVVLQIDLRVTEGCVSIPSTLGCSLGYVWWRKTLYGP